MKKFRYKGRARPVQIVLQEGDEITVSHYRTIRQMESRPMFEEVENKPRKQQEKKPVIIEDSLDVSDESGNSNEGA